MSVMTLLLVFSLTDLPISKRRVRVKQCVCVLSEIYFSSFIFPSLLSVSVSALPRVRNRAGKFLVYALNFYFFLF